MASNSTAGAQASASLEFDLAVTGFQEFARKAADEVTKQLVGTLCQVSSSELSTEEAFQRFVEKVGLKMAHDLAGTLCWEHQHHVERISGEILRLRSELSRVAGLMQAYLQREKQVQVLLEELSTTPLDDHGRAALQEVLSCKYDRDGAMKNLFRPSLVAQDAIVPGSRTGSPTPKILVDSDVVEDLMDASQSPTASLLPPVEPMIARVEPVTLPEVPPLNIQPLLAAGKDMADPSRLSCSTYLLESAETASDIDASVERVSPQEGSPYTPALGIKEAASVRSSPTSLKEFAAAARRSSPTSPLARSSQQGVHSSPAAFPQEFAASPTSPLQSATAAVTTTDRLAEYQRRLAELVGSAPMEMQLVNGSSGPSRGPQVRAAGISIGHSTAGLRPKVAELRALVAKATTTPPVSPVATLRGPTRDLSPVSRSQEAMPSPGVAPALQVLQQVPSAPHLAVTPCLPGTPPLCYRASTPVTSRPEDRGLPSPARGSDAPMPLPPPLHEGFMFSPAVSFSNSQYRQGLDLHRPADNLSSSQRGIDVLSSSQRGIDVLSASQKTAPQVVHRSPRQVQRTPTPQRVARTNHGRPCC